MSVCANIAASLCMYVCVCGQWEKKREKAITMRAMMMTTTRISKLICDTRVIVCSTLLDVFVQQIDQMIRGMMMSLSTSASSLCKYIMSFSHFNFECMYRVQSVSAHACLCINQRFAFHLLPCNSITQPICHFSDINLEYPLCVFVCTMHEFAYFFFGGCRRYGCYFKNYTFELLNNRYKKV